MREILFQEIASGVNSGDLSTDKTVVIAANARLAWQLSGLSSLAKGLHIYSLEQWLFTVGKKLSLPRCLDTDTELLYWQQVIKEDLCQQPGDEYYGHFNLSGLARLALEANELLVFAPELITNGKQDTQSLLRWRKKLFGTWEQLQVMDKISWCKLAIKRLSEDPQILPEKLVLAGWVHHSPLLGFLLENLPTKCEILNLHNKVNAKTQCTRHVFPDESSEIRAAAEWAVAAAKRGERIVLVVPDLAGLGQPLQLALDEAWLGDRLLNEQLPEQRWYDFSLAPAITQQPVVACALGWLNLLSELQRINLLEFCRWLRDPHWGEPQDLDSRHLYETLLRKRLNKITNWPEISTTLASADGLPASLQRLLTLPEIIKPVQDMASWIDYFNQTLTTLNWPIQSLSIQHSYLNETNNQELLSERDKTSTSDQFEQQVVLSFYRQMQNLIDNSSLYGLLNFSESVRQLEIRCQQTTLQPASPPRPALQVIGVLEPIAVPVDAIWVLSMSSRNWPPPPQLNPLLPAKWQRKHITRARSGQQAAFALQLQQRWLTSSKQVYFSYPLCAGENQPLSASTLLKNITLSPTTMPVGDLLARKQGLAELELINDSNAPGMLLNEHLAGGVKALEAQAICPAWAYFEYRLGAHQLGDGRELLDASMRGSLVHQALEHFWRGADSQILFETEQVHQRLQLAVKVAISNSAFKSLKQNPRLCSLETQRLLSLLTTWLEAEKQRETPFRVTACEQRKSVHIAGINLSCIADRLDELLEHPGKYILFDYKTSASVNIRDTLGEPCLKPQLPLYIVCQPEKIVAVAYAHIPKVKWSGLSQENGYLPGIKACESNDLSTGCNNWDEQLSHWKRSLGLLARELRDGDAELRFEKIEHLQYCPVLPLLRLGEIGHNV